MAIKKHDKRFPFKKGIGKSRSRGTNTSWRLSGPRARR